MITTGAKGVVDPWVPRDPRIVIPPVDTDAPVDEHEGMA